MRRLLLFIFISQFGTVAAQDRMTPELLWSMGRVGGLGITADGKNVVYSVSTPNAGENKSSRRYFSIPITGGTPVETSNPDGLLKDKHVSPNGNHKLSIEEVKVNKVFGADFYPNLARSNVYIYDNLNYRHWDEWEDGLFNHLFLHDLKSGGQAKDLMPGEPYDCPQKPFGGDEDYTWSPDSRKILYVTKKKHGTDYAVSTNTDIYSYDISTGATTNITDGMKGYDTSPSFSSKGVLAWLSMKRDGYESDKNDIIVMNGSVKSNLTEKWDGTVSGYSWNTDGMKIFFTAATDGTVQLFEVDYPGTTKKLPLVKQLTKGDFDVSGIVGQAGNLLVISRMDMNHATELYTVDLRSGTMQQLTHVNEAVYSNIKLSKVEKRYVTTTDGLKMLVWVIYPPDFDPNRKYPTLLYCQGGPQVPLTQFYSFRWNFQLMAANGYIVVAPDRRGMPGFGVAWNEQISKDWGGQVIQDYLSAIDNISRESFVDRERMGCVGASFGGFSVFYLAGVHNNRFKSFIAHDGVFNLKSMYGTTEELWFVDWDLGGPYWEKDNAAAQKTYAQFDPSSMVEKWNTPILIVQGGRDYRVPIGQSLEAFQAAQLRGVKSRLLYLPEENHWVLTPQNALIWQHEFFKWLKETL